MTVLHRAVEREGFSAARWDEAFLPGAVERVARAGSDLRLGLPVVLAQEGQGWLVLAVEGLTEPRLQAARAMGPAVLLLAPERLSAMGADGAAFSADGLTPEQLLSLANPVLGDGAGPDVPVWMDEVPMQVRSAALALVKRAHLLPAVVAVRLPDPRQGRVTVLACGEVDEVLRRLPIHNAVSAAGLPVAVSSAAHLEVFRPEDGGAEHYALRIGVPDADRPVLVRLHSACFTGDVLGSLKCDCGPQLQAAMAAMAQEGAGVLLYLNQEGRGIGLANKMRTYALQHRGLDTVEANHHLGFADDERDFRLGAVLLQRMGIGAVRLMTNNPAKVKMLAAHGIRVVERVPLQVGARAENAHYLATKAAKSGHLLR